MDPLDPDESELEPRSASDASGAARSLLAEAPDELTARYEQRGTLGRGGMGEVVRVFDRRLRREVALKRLRLARPDEEDVGRFLREAQVMSQLEHPHVPPVHDLGVGPGGAAYFTMKRLEGRTLVRLVEAGEGSLHARLDIFLKVCDAVAYAHARGVLHRDIKPSNVMVGSYGEVYLVDWGLAKPLDDSMDPLPRAVTADVDASGEPLTGGGARMGTPGYMSPEQARGEHRDLDSRADVYALGVLLYYLLTGRRPFTAKGALAVRQVLEGDFTPPRQESPGVPRELEAVVLKAMSLRRDDRYASVDDLSSDIRRWLEGEPVRAAHYTWGQRTAKWARRHRLPLGIGASAAAVAGSLLLATLAINLTTVTEARDAALEASVVAQLALADSEVALAEASADLGRLEQAMRSLDLAEARYDAYGGPAARARLTRSALAERYPPPDLTVRRPGLKPTHAALSDDGRRLLFVAGSVSRVLDVPMGHSEVQRRLLKDTDRLLTATFVGDRPLQVVHRGDEVLVFDVGSGETVHRAPVAEGSLPSGSVAWLVGDGRYLVLRQPGVGTTSLDLLEGGPAGPLLPDAYVVSVSADGSRLVGFEVRGSIHRSAEALVIWDRATGQVVRRFDRWLGYAALSSDGRLMAWDEVGAVSLVEVDTGRVRWRDLEGPKAPRWAFVDGDRGLVGVGADERIVLLDVRDGSTLGSRRIVGGPTASRGSVEIATGGGAAATWDHETLRVWTVGEGTDVPSWVASERNLTAVDVTADGLLAVSAGWDGIVRVWEWRTRSLLGQLEVCPEGTRDVATSPDGRWILTADRDGHARLVDLATLSVAWDWSLPGVGIAMGATFTPDGKAWVAFEGGTLGAWSPETGAPIGEPLTGQIESVWGMERSPDGRHALLTNRGREGPPIEIWDLTTHRRTWAAPRSQQAVYRGGFDPTGSSVVAGTHEGIPQLWQLLDGVAVAPPHALPERNEAIQAASFDPSGSWIVLGGYDGQLDVFDATTQEPLASLGLHERSIVDMAWVPGDDGVLITASGDATLRVTDLERWDKLAPSARVVDVDGAIDELTEGERWSTAARGSALRGNWARALYELDQATAAGAQASHLQRGRALWSLGRTDEARAELTAAELAREAASAPLRAWIRAEP